MSKKNTNKRSFFRSLSFIGLGKERDYFIENLTALLASGMPMIEAILAVKAEVRVKLFQKIIDEIIESIQSGFSLGEALEQTGLFSKHVTTLIKIGEKSGKLVDNLKIITIEQQKERSLKSKIRSATMYPVFVLTLTMIVGIAIAWFILPKLSDVFSQMDIELPALTKFLIETGLFLNAYGIFVIPAFFVLLFLIFYFIFAFRSTKFIGEYVLFFLPGIKKLLKETEIARFGYLLGTLFLAGMPPHQGLASLTEATNYSRYKKFYSFLKENISEGNSFKKSFSAYKKINKLLPPAVQQLIAAGEKSGSLSETLLKIGENYESKTDTTAKNLTVILEPILLVIVWLGVVSVALAVVLPIYSLIGGFNSPETTNPPPPVTQETQENSENSTQETEGEAEAPIDQGTTFTENDPFSNETIDETLPTNATEEITGEAALITSPPRDMPDLPTELNENEVITVEPISDNPIKKIEVVLEGGNDLTIRAEANPESQILGYVHNAEQYPFLVRENEFYQIQLPDGTTGWVSEKYVQEKN